MARTRQQRGLSLPKRKALNRQNSNDNLHIDSTSPRCPSSLSSLKRRRLVLLSVCTAVYIVLQFALSFQIPTIFIDDSQHSSSSSTPNHSKNSLLGYNIKEHDRISLLSNFLSVSSSNTTHVRSGQQASETKQDQEQSQRYKLLTTFRQLSSSSKSSIRLPFEFQAININKSGQSQQQQHKISLCVHLSTSKLDRFLFLIRRWGGPVSASIYITNINQVIEFVTFYELYANDGLQYTNFHLFMENLDIPPEDDNNNNSISFNKNNKAYDYGYPYNILRNLAAENIDTEYLLSIDVDFMTQQNASVKLTAMLNDNPQMVTDLQKNNVVMILPAFELIINATDIDIVHTIGNLQGGGEEEEGETIILPETKQQLSHMMDTKKIDIAHYYDYPPCQRATNFQRWFGNEKSPSSSSNSSTDSNYYFIDYELQYEPYVLLYKDAPAGVPKYFESFRGWGHDKSSFVMELAFTGFQFAVLMDWFLVHLEHKSLKPSNEDPTAVERRENLLEVHYFEFRHHLRNKFSWDDTTYQMIFQKTKKIVGWNKINHPYVAQQQDVPILVGWKENNGRVFGRLYSKDWIHPLLIVTSLLVDYNYTNGSISRRDEKQNGKLLSLKSDQVIRASSGRSYFLSNAALEMRSSAKRNPIM